MKRQLSSEEIAELAGRGVRIDATAWVPPVTGKHAFGFYLAHVKHSALDSLAGDDRVVRIDSLAGRREPHNDESNDMTEVRRLHSGHTGTNLTGTGVRIAIADSGLDLFSPRHPHARRSLRCVRRIRHRRVEHGRRRSRFRSRHARRGHRPRPWNGIRWSLHRRSTRCRPLLLQDWQRRRRVHDRRGHSRGAPACLGSRLRHLFD